MAGDVWLMPALDHRVSIVVKQEDMIATFEQLETLILCRGDAHVPRETKGCLWYRLITRIINNDDFSASRCQTFYFRQRLTEHVIAVVCGDPDTNLCHVKCAV